MFNYTSYLKKRKRNKPVQSAIQATVEPSQLIQSVSASAKNEVQCSSSVSEELCEFCYKQQQYCQEADLLPSMRTPAISSFICRDVNCQINQLPCMMAGKICSENAKAQRELKSTHKGNTNSMLVTSPDSSGLESSRATNSIKKIKNHSVLPEHNKVNNNKNDEQKRKQLPEQSDCLENNMRFSININLDLLSWLLFFLAFCTRFYKLSTPAHVVFDEIHYGKSISHYMRNIFFFDQHPPLGKQLVAAVAHSVGYDSNYSFPHVGAEYPEKFPIFWLRFLPALCGSALAPAVYKLLLEVRLNRWTSFLGGLLVICDNALLTQSRFVLMESMLLLFCTLGLCCLLKFQASNINRPCWWICGFAAATFFTWTTSIKYIGIFSVGLAIYLMCRYLWDLLFDSTISNMQIGFQILARIVIFTFIPICMYLGMFYIHIETLHRAGPHDSAMTSAFQASLEGGLASITRGQPLKVVHGSQITLRHTHGRTCWLHSHAHVYPVRYPDNRGSSHQQQVTCYSFKDVNNWWIVKRPQREDLVVGDDLDPIRHGDVIQLVHGITSRALNSHDVAAPMTPQCQEVTCYIDYEIKMKGELLWRVEILNRDSEGQIWHAIKSEVRLIHKSTGAALRFTGRQLPGWGFNQHEIVADRVVNHPDSVWNVEEHRYTKTQDQHERERQLLNAEMIPTKKTKLTFLQKFFELQAKMVWNSRESQGHMYSSEPLEWPLLNKGIAYWVDKKSNGQIHLLGNVLLWYTGTISLFVYASLGTFYAIRRRRYCYDLPPNEWQRFLRAGDIFFVGYLAHYLPYFFVERTLFLHNYLPAFLFKLMMLCYMVEHVDYLLRQNCQPVLWISKSFRFLVLVWIFLILKVFVIFLPLSYGIRKLTVEDLNDLRWKDTWDFIMFKHTL